jgi:hypothetical protein
VGTSFEDVAKNPYPQCDGLRPGVLERAVIDSVIAPALPRLPNWCALSASDHIACQSEDLKRLERQYFAGGSIFLIDRPDVLR